MEKFFQLKPASPVEFTRVDEQRQHASEVARLRALEDHLVKLQAERSLIKQTGTRPVWTPRGKHWLLWLLWALSYPARAGLSLVTEPHIAVEAWLRRRAARNRKLKVGPCEVHPKLWRKILSYAVVVNSGSVPDRVYAKRMEICGQCSHAREFEGELFCQCCGCGQRKAAALAKKNRYRLQQCPLGKFRSYQSSPLLH